MVGRLQVPTQTEDAACIYQPTTLAARCSHVGSPHTPQGDNVPSFHTEDATRQRFKRRGNDAKSVCRGAVPGTSTRNVDRQTPCLQLDDELDHPHHHHQQQLALAGEPPAPVDRSEPCRSSVAYKLVIGAENLTRLNQIDSQMRCVVRWARPAAR
ncbi:hypothetical protein VDGL01_10735 [Verticillium dahliae]